MKWLSSLGGPLIIMNKTDLANWQGNLSDHYDKACEVDDFITSITLLDYKLLVLGDEPLPTAIIVIDESCFFIACWRYGEDECSVEHYLSIFKNNFLNFEPTHQINYQINNELILFDAVYSGDEASGIDINVTKGEYVISSYDYKPDNNTALLIHFFQKNAT